MVGTAITSVSKFALCGAPRNQGIASPRSGPSLPGRAEGGLVLPLSRSRLTPMQDMPAVRCSVSLMVGLAR